MDEMIEKDIEVSKDELEDEIDIEIERVIIEWKELKEKLEQNDRREKALRALNIRIEQKEKNLYEKEEALKNLQYDLDEKVRKVEGEISNFYSERIEIQLKYENDAAEKYNLIINDIKQRSFDRDSLEQQCKELIIENTRHKEENQDLKQKVLMLKKDSEEYQKNFEAINEINDLRETVNIYKNLFDEEKNFKQAIKELTIDKEEMKNEIKELRLDKDTLANKQRRLTNKLVEYQERDKEKLDIEDNTTSSFLEIIQDEKKLMNTQEVRSTFSEKKLVDGFMDFLVHAGFSYDEKLVRAFIAAIRSSRFCILKGYSGTGKSSLPKLLSLYLGAHCETIPVQTNWKTKSDLIGFYNYFNYRFVSTAFTQVLLRANVNKNKIFIIVLDEMNLARVEYYFSEINSKLFLPKEEQYIELFDGKITMTDELEEFIKGGNKIIIPDNIYFIGTINEDDSVYPISDKIYDRAQVIDFIDAQATDSNGSIDEAFKDSCVNNYHIKIIPNEKLSIKIDDIKTYNVELISEVNSFIKKEFNKIVAYRSLDQVKKFISCYINMVNQTKETKENIKPIVDAIDLMLVSKFIPKMKYTFANNMTDKLYELQILLEHLFEQNYKINKDHFSKLEISKQLDMLYKEFNQ